MQIYDSQWCCEIWSPLSFIQIRGLQPFFHEILLENEYVEAIIYFNGNIILAFKINKGT
jgi:hypothetical protein